ncbi:MAG: M43 family zinc metalloprotease [Bacteroidota bacterium]
MKKQLLFILGAAALSFGSTAQEKRDPNLIPCATYDAMEEAFKTDPNLKFKYNLVQSQMDLEYKAALSKNNSGSKTAAVVYTVPVVFHVMGPLNVTDQTFENLIGYINNDYGALGADKPTISPAFSSLYVDSEIRFALAKRDPNGNCTNGIIRHDADNSYWSQTSPAYNYSGTGTNRWPVNKYLNIYIVECISGPSNPCPPTGSYIGGYTYLPGGAPSTSADAIVMLRNQLAQTNYTDSRTLSHEMGHWLNLSHTFGNNNCTGTSCGDDGVADTPTTTCHFSTCPASIGGNSCDVSNNSNVENIMDYSSCTKMFTQGQVTRMRAALNSSTAGRNNLWTAANYTATGISGTYTCAPVADFEANKVYNCAGNTFTFTSLSQVGTSGGVNWTFQGGTPATSTATTQVVTYATPGTYSVSLTATNTSGTNTMNKTSYINVINGTGGALLPAPYDFQGATLPASITVTNANAGSPTWIQNNATGANSTTKSIYINNASSTSTPGHIDIFETNIYNFSNTTNINFSYYYAYAKRLSTQADTFRVQYSLDCGGSWSNIIGVPTMATMATSSGSVTTTAFVPTAGQWVLKTFVPTLLNTLANKPSVKFRFWFKSDVTVGRSNNIYIDQINITGSVITSISELEKSMELGIYPNPTSSASTLDFTISKEQNAKISVMDVMGRVLEQNIPAVGNDGHVTYVINQNGHLASGVYIVNIDVNNQRISKKLIVQ